MPVDHAARQQHDPEQGRSAHDDPLGMFGRYLSLWVALCIVLGIALGNFFPGAFALLSSLEIARVNLVVAVLIWIMIYPMMVNVDFSALRRLGDRPKGLIITVVVNWLIKPFTMAGLGVLFFELLFRDLINPADAKQYIAGLILLGAAPCTAMVFVWSHLTRGDATYTLVQVSLNDIIMIFAFAPLVALLLGVTDLVVPWETLLLSVVLYVVIPLGAGYLTRRALSSAGNEHRIERFTAALKPYTILGLLATVVLLFAFQGQRIIDNPIVILLIALPLVVQSYGIFVVGYGWAWLWGIPFQIAAPAALIGTSNFFELAVAVAISLFGLNSGAALATVVGVLVEVPVMLSLVAIANRTQGWFEPGTQRHDLPARQSPAP
jgi:ACR3 family arsenite transporter